MRTVHKISELKFKPSHERIASSAYKLRYMYYVYSVVTAWFNSTALNRYSLLFYFQHPYLL